jgi:carboxymethylenebutenolidase
MAELTEFSRPDGKTCPAYAVGPLDAPGVVVIQEWWGLNAQIKTVADRLAEAGYRALVPDLYRGRVTHEAREASHLMNGLDWVDAATEDVRGALSHLSAGGKKAAVLGFCMGGALALIAAARVPEASAAICFYGIPPKEAADPSAIAIPLQCHFASEDDWCTPAAVDALEAALARSRAGFELFRYVGAHHAFFNEANPRHDPAASRLAFQRTLTFLAKHLT